MFSCAHCSLKSPQSIFTSHSYMLNISIQKISTNINDVTNKMNVTEFVWSHWELLTFRKRGV